MAKWRTWLDLKTEIDRALIEHWNDPGNLRTILYGSFASVNDRVTELVAEINAEGADPDDVATEDLGELRAFMRGVILGCYLERHGLGIEPDRDAPRDQTPPN